MVYFELRRLGFDCGTEQKDCPKYPDGCESCIKGKLKKMGFKIHSNLRIQELDSEEERKHVYQKRVWTRFLDVLNIKHIILMSKDSGTAIFNYPITGAGVDVDLLTGFIQANVSFSEKEVNGGPISEDHFYEFKYKDFNILLKNGDHLRVSLVLEKNASQSLKSRLSEFIDEYEFKYISNILKFEKSGELSFNKTLDFIIEKFNIHLVFPMTISHAIPPNIANKINESYVQKAIMKIIKELLLHKPFFFINNILYRVKEIVNIDLKVVLYELYQLIEFNIIIPTKLKDAKTKIKTLKRENDQKDEKKTLISRLSKKDHETNLKEKIKDMEDAEAEELMKKFDKIGKNAEEALIYQDALDAYQKALFIAKQFNFKEAEGQFSFKVLESEKKIADAELKYYEDAGKKAEKEKDYITSINYYKTAIKKLQDSLMTVQVNPEQIKKRIKKMDKKINKLEQKM
jgi:hypothetical protein